jgi:hypothetical protein
MKSQTVTFCPSTSGDEKPDHWHRRLLRLHDHRPRHGASKPSDEFPPSHR